LHPLSELTTEAYREWSKFKERKEDAVLSSTSHADGAATALMLRIHADELVSRPSAIVKAINK
jgi:hypothetical protein